MPAPDQFHYDGFALDPGRGTVRCSYRTGDHGFTETFTFGPTGNWDDPAVTAAARLLFLLAGVSYYKTTAAPVVDLGELATTATERAFLEMYYRNGLGEFAYRNGLDLSALRVRGPDAAPAAPLPYDPAPGRPLVPFGGGIDSIVTVDAIAAAHPDTELFVVHPGQERFAAIEDVAALTGLPLRRVARDIDPLVRRSAQLGFLNGHIPVTAIITAAAIVAAVLDGRDAVVLSNEWSASVPTLVVEGRPVNHQWSKGEEFERALRDIMTQTFAPGLAVFSYLRPRTELWVAARFATLTKFHDTFRSCNRAFHQDPGQRLTGWCGACDKCCFIDLVLAPFMARADLAAVFGGAEPLDDPANEGRFRALLGLDADTKPFECVGDVDECRAALRLATRRPDRTDAAILERLRAAVDTLFPTSSSDDVQLEPRGAHGIPDLYAPADLLVRAR